MRAALSPAGLAFLAAVTTGCPGDGAQKVRVVEAGAHALIERLEPLVAPGPLAEGHRDVADLERCEACHELAGPIPESKCLACHEEIGRRRAARAGHHGADLAGRCPDCHADHDGPLVVFDREAFNHERALFPLEGRHRTVACDECHEDPESGRFTYLPVEHDRCDACHEDPHRGTLEPASCETCHDAWDFRRAETAFDHDGTAFPLDALHRALDCSACHRSAPVYEPLSSDCAGCHAEVAAAMRGEVAVGGSVRRGRASPHEGLVGCTDCHDPSSGDESALAHAERCAHCHQPRYAALFLERTALLAEARARRPDDPRVRAAAAVSAHDFPFVLGLLREAGALEGR